MAFEKRIRSRLDDKMLLNIDKKLALKKYSSYDMSKFIREAIENFVINGLFEYISNTNAIIKILNDNILDLNGIHGNITQITDHLKDFDDDKNIKNLISNFKLIKTKVIENVQHMKSLIKLLQPFEKQYKKDHVVMTRIDQNTYQDITDQIEEYTNLKLDMSKFIRAALKYYLNSKYYKLSDNQISLARELINNSNDIKETTDQLNKIAFYFNAGANIDLGDIIDLRRDLSEALNSNKDIVRKLYLESEKIL